MVEASRLGGGAAPPELAGLPVGQYRWSNARADCLALRLLYLKGMQVPAQKAAGAYRLIEAVQSPTPAADPPAAPTHDLPDVFNSARSSTKAA